MSDLKTLVVCLSIDLPSEADRSKDYIYFVYDKLLLFMGKTLYGENFCIADTMPEEPDVDTLYICLDDGYVKVFDDYQVINIGKAKDDATLELLSKSGSIYYFHSKDRYIDKQNRLLVLPFNNGTYSLTVEVPNDLLYNENTVIKYNEEKGAFEIYGETYDEDPLETSGFVGKETETVKIDVKDGRIEGNLKISKNQGNLIRVIDDGLYVAVRNTITQREFDSWKASYEDYRDLVETALNATIEDLEKIQSLVSEEAVNAKILGYLEEIEPTVESMFNEYDTMADTIQQIEDEAEIYAQNRFDTIEADLNAKIDDAIHNPWENISQISNKEFATVSMAVIAYLINRDKVDKDFALIASAVGAYKINTQKEVDKDFALIASSIGAYKSE